MQIQTEKHISILTLCKITYKKAAKRNEILRGAIIVSIGQFKTDQLLSQMNSFLSKNSILVLDNTKIYHDQELFDYLDTFEIKVKFLPSYSLGLKLPFLSSNNF
ncbi:hypothetical protein RhiirA5_436829 [Rhizophagus irregularis]|uniref:Tc1-like transposase DDE domain-containing protein n=1 Tax=Rhizophagus irregularis TaxID=588596 RepID=A0A2N0NLC7_9GLOM|nr:hypothetical protein RhiirA5_436829 [Rhizophagus irregularis]PKC53299.1 hypothetical protein RhiirA1_479579 [Rhizophagus irregularis]